MSDLHGKTVLVTGANSGIGKETARALARASARVVMACRDAGRGEAARRELQADSGNDALELAVVDLSSQAQVRGFADAFTRAHDRLDVLVNNAGIWSARREETGEGIERTWATNMLGYFLLTERLRPLLARSAPARIVNVASELARDLDLGDVEFRRRSYEGVTAYAQSKQANRMWTWALARRLEGTRVTANAMHPGGVNTPLFGKGGGWKAVAGTIYAKLAGRTPAEGADTVVFLAADPSVEGVSGRFWKDRHEAVCRFRDPRAEDELFALCESMSARHG